MADEPSVEDEATARFLVFGAFGETIMRFQLLEMSFWSILAVQLKKGVTLDQGMAKIGG